jgi:hypothetical protein
MSKREEVIQFLVDLEIDPRVEVGDIGLFLQFCDGDINLALDRLTIDEEWVIDRYDKVMDQLNNEIFDPIFEKAADTGLTGDDLFVTLNNLIEIEMCILTKKYDSLELYIAGLMCDG